jgi:rod shape-determining protein MreD
MNKHYLKYLILLPFFVLLQILVLNEVLFFSYLNPYLYLALILSLPLKTPKWFLLVYAFSLGFLIDLFSGVLGFHSTATVLLAFVKPTISKISIPHNILGDYDKISMTKIGGKSFITYAFLLIIIHNTVLFSLEHLSFSFAIFVKIVSSSILTLVLILILELFQNKKK